MALRGEGLSAVRAKILAEHKEVRRGLRAMDDSARAVARGDSSHVSKMRARLLEFAVFFESHLQMEEEHLVPILAELDAWGMARVEHLADEHRGQRLMLRAMIHESERFTKTPKELAEDAMWLVRVLKKDMVDEEKMIAELQEDGFDPSPMSG